MGLARNQPTTLDLFSGPAVGDLSPPSASPTATTPAETPRLILPSNLSAAVKRLNDGELDQLLSAILAEQERRGTKQPMLDQSAQKGQVKAVAAPLTAGKLNAIRAAFKAGVTPSRIAREFGISQADVRKALAADKAAR
jgi:hypothetical protein